MLPHPRLSSTRWFPRDGAHAEVRGVSKRFGGVHALTTSTSAIAQGSIHALVGENGAGKSTLGKIIAGVHRPDDGELWVDGAPRRLPLARDALADGMTMIAQEPTLVPHRSVLENVFLGVEDTAAGVVEQRDAHAALRRARRASGHRAAAQTARAHAARRRPAEGRDPARVRPRRAASSSWTSRPRRSPRDEAERLFELVRRLRQRGTTIVYVSHFLPEVLALADTVTVLRDGQARADVAAADETPESLVTAMLGRAIGLAFPERHLRRPTRRWCSRCAASRARRPSRTSRSRSAPVRSSGSPG